MQHAEHPPAALPVPWRGAVALACLMVAAAFGPDLWPGSKAPGFGQRVVPVVFLAVAAGAGLNAMRSASPVDRVLGLAAVVIGVVLAAFVAADCLRILGWFGA
jgi:hypothetical protein